MDLYVAVAQVDVLIIVLTVIIHVKMDVLADVEILATKDVAAVVLAEVVMVDVTAAAILHVPVVAKVIAADNAHPATDVVLVADAMVLVA